MLGLTVEVDQRLRVRFRFESFSADSRSCWAMVSTSIPRKVRHVVGPSTLCGAAGKPKREPR